MEIPGHGWTSYDANRLQLIINNSSTSSNNRHSNLCGILICVFIIFILFTKLIVRSQKILDVDIRDAEKYNLANFFS